MITQNTLLRLRRKYPPGSRVELIYLDDPYQKIPKGTLGTVQCVDDIGTIHVSWTDIAVLVYGEILRVIDPDNATKD